MQVKEFSSRSSQIREKELVDAEVKGTVPPTKFSVSFALAGLTPGHPSSCKRRLLLPKHLHQPLHQPEHRCRIPLPLKTLQLELVQGWPEWERELGLLLVLVLVLVFELELGLLREVLLVLV